MERVDAVYERADHRIVFFVGRHFYVLAGNSQLESGPTPIERLGLPPELERVDAAMRWGWNGKTYFFSGEFVCSEAPSFEAKLQRGGKVFPRRNVKMQVQLQRRYDQQLLNQEQQQQQQ